MDGDLVSTARELGPWVVLAVLMLRDYVPKAAAWFASTQARREDREASIEERQIRAWERLADRLDQAVVGMTKMTTMMEDQERTIRDVLNSQASILERLSRGRDLYTVKTRAKEEKGEPIE